jgi:SP family sugar:H+ symporter-like MFS transporter
MPEDRPLHSGYVTLLACVAALGGFLFGFDSGVINGTVDAMKKTFHEGDAAAGFAVASVLLGCAVGAFVAGNLADLFGRKPMLIITSLLFLGSLFGTGLAWSAFVFIAFRILGGLAIGAASVLAPTYIAEISPAHLRGRLASLQQLAIVLGLFGAAMSNYFIEWTAGGDAYHRIWFGFRAWRWMFWDGMIPSAAFLLGASLIPESPRYLVARGRKESAAKVFARIQGGDVAERIRDVESSLAGARKHGFAEIFQPGTWRIWPIVWVGVGLAAFQQFVGINVIFYYGAVLWNTAGFSAQDALLISVVTSLINILSTILAMALIDHIGRKPLLLIGSLGMTLTLGVAAAAFATGRLDSYQTLQLSPGATWAALVAANLYIVFFAVSWGPVVWVLLGEMFANRFRGAALAVSGASNWVGNFLVTWTFPILLGAIGLGAAYALYALAALVSFFFVLAKVRETKGKSLEAM